MLKKLLKLFFLNTLFSSSLIILFLLIKDQITNYLTFLKESSPKLLELQTAIQNNVTENIATLQSSLTEITKTASKFFWFQYILIPFLIILLFILFQGYIFYLLSNSKDLKKYLIRFSLVTIPFYILLLLSLKYIILLPITLILAYFLLIVYLNLNNPIKQALKSLKISWKSILIYLLFLVLIIFYLISKLLVVISILGEASIVKLLISIMFLLIFILLITIVEIWFSKKV